MSSHGQQSYSQESPDPQMWRFRWFLVYLYAVALILSIIAAVVIAFVTKSIYPGAIPAPLASCNEANSQMGICRLKFYLIINMFLIISEGTT